MPAAGPGRPQPHCGRPGGGIRARGLGAPSVEGCSCRCLEALACSARTGPIDSGSRVAGRPRFAVILAPRQQAWRAAGLPARPRRLCRGGCGPLSGGDPPWACQDPWRQKWKLFSPPFPPCRRRTVAASWRAVWTGRQGGTSCAWGRRHPSSIRRSPFAALPCPPASPPCAPPCWPLTSWPRDPPRARAPRSSSAGSLRPSFAPARSASPVFLHSLSSLALAFPRSASSPPIYR